MYYDDYEVVEYNAAGQEVERYNRIGDRSVEDWLAAEAKTAFLRAAGGAAEGIGGLTGVNNYINMAGQTLGYNPNLATRDEVLTGLEQGLRSFYRATQYFHLVSAHELTMYRAGNQSLSATLGNIRPSFLAVANEESKFLIGTDWTGFRDNPGATIGSTAFGIASWIVPTKVPKISTTAFAGRDSAALTPMYQGAPISRLADETTVAGTSPKASKGNRIGVAPGGAEVMTVDARVSVVGQKYGRNIQSDSVLDSSLPPQIPTARSSARPDANNILAKLNSGAVRGAEPTPENIRFGTVRMEDHPDFEGVRAELESAGYPLEVRVASLGVDPHVERIQIVDKAGNVLRIEQRVVGIESMRYIDLLHEVGHVQQLLERFDGNSPFTERKVQLEGRPLKDARDQSGVLNDRQNAVMEFHNRLQEYNMLADQGAPRELLDEHASGVKIWHRLYRDALHDKRGKPRKEVEWAREHFPDIRDLMTTYVEHGGEL
ncbi:hypothetical protein ABZ540_23590 [Nocardia xishanensis]|uniref:hypothetical protein n=1 Tax=Nocardia xishanensis TaxID=238964 RepID=UPI0033D62F6E